MASPVRTGMAAGAVGTVALNIATYVDMAVRARPASSVPAKLAGVIADKAGLDLATGTGEAAKEEEKNRESGLGALLGYVSGLGVAALYGAVRPHLRWLPVPVAGVLLGLAAMATSDVPIGMSGVSDPSTWAPEDWAADLIPHLIYGLVTAIAYDAFAE
ncbi:MAG: hypothetical protein M3Y58_09110 [Chloroflexota bacterium]|nr:hypothetical protein [Chloroflexota bacterium]